MDKPILFFTLFILMSSIAIVYAEIPPTAVKVNGYLLDWCSHVGCGNTTANIYCARTGQGMMDAAEKGIGAKAAGGTWTYSSTGGYYNPNGDEYFTYISCNFTGQLYIGGTTTPLIVYSNGWPLDYCSFAACGQSTAEVYCDRTQGKGLISYEKSLGTIAGSPGTWEYTLDSGYHDTSGTQFFKSIICGNEPKPEPGIACYNDLECGEGQWLSTYGIYWGPRCMNGKIYQPYQYYKCDNAGTYQSSCTSGVNAWQVKEECAYGCSTETNTCNPPPEACDGTDNDGDSLIDEGGNALCNDGLWCNGQEICNGASGCSAGIPPDCSDGISCTADYCDEYSDSCGKSIPYDSRCNDGLWCNGKETCNKDLGCQPGTSPCNDNVACTNNICNENTDSCSYVENNAYCDDGLFCNGKETCNWLFGCQAGTPPTAGGFACVAYTCDEANDIVWRSPNDAYCQDGLFCNGYEYCSASYGCRPGTARSCNDGISCTTDSCNENTDSCDNIPTDNDGDTYNCLGDCNDNNNMIWQYINGYRDNDLDSYGINPSQQVCSGLSLPNGYVANNLDCNDNNNKIYPGASEICNALDDDCDGTIDEGFDGDGDGVTFCGGDCDDNDPQVNINMAEICDGKDNNCDGVIDDGTCAGICVDNDNDKYGLNNDPSCQNSGYDCNDNNKFANPGRPETCDTPYDDNCDGIANNGCDNDADTFNAQSDCNDYDAAINPNAIEICNSKDDNCNGLIDENGGCGDSDEDNIVDAVDICPSDPDNKCNINNTQQYITSTTSTMLSTDNGDTALQITSGDVTADTVITIQKNTVLQPNFALSTGVPTVKNIYSYSFGPEGQQFSGNIMITFNWQDADNNGREDTTNLKEDNMDMYWYNPTTSNWEAQSANCNLVDNYCTLITDHFSEYALAATEDSDGDGYSGEEDCNDNNSAINPGSIEIPGNSVDENCDSIALCDSSAAWRNQGKFVSCVAKEAEKLLKQGLITAKEKDALVSNAVRSKR